MDIKKYKLWLLYKITVKSLLLVFILVSLPLLVIIASLSLYTTNNKHLEKVLGESSCGCYINGYPFIDINNDGKYDNGETYIDKPITFSLYDKKGKFLARQAQNTGTTSNPYWFSFNQLQVNVTYTVTIDAPPSGYTLTTPQSFTVTTGNSCSTGGNADAHCTADGNVFGIDFGLTSTTQPIHTSIPTSTPIPTVTTVHTATSQQTSDSTQSTTASNPPTNTPTLSTHSTSSEQVNSGSSTITRVNTQNVYPINPTTSETSIQNTVITVNQPSTTTTSSNSYPVNNSVTYQPQQIHTPLYNTAATNSNTVYPVVTQPENTQPGTQTNIPHNANPTVSTSQPTQLVPRYIPPLPSNTDFGVFSIPDKSVLGGIATIKIKNNTDAAIDLELLPLTGIPDSVFLGRGTLDATHHTTAITWDTRNTPNGMYNLYAKIYKSDQSSELINPVEVIVKNNQTVNNNAPTSIASATRFVPAQIPVDANTAVTDIRNTVSQDTNGLALTFGGKAKPNSFVTVLIFSDPITATVQTNANGSWVYTLEKPLPPGIHSSYVLVTTAGATVRSELKQFTIASAEAAGPVKDNLVLATQNDTEGIPNYFLIISGVVLYGISGFILVFIAKQLFFTSPESEKN